MIDVLISHQPEKIMTKFSQRGDCCAACPVGYYNAVGREASQLYGLSRPPIVESSMCAQTDYILCAAVFFRDALNWCATASLVRTKTPGILWMLI